MRGRPKMYTPEEMEEQWEAFKRQCDNQTVRKTNFYQGGYVTQEVPAQITYTIEGFALFLGMTKGAFYKTYANEGSTEFVDLVGRIREECQADARRKFELGVIPTQLSGLWMSHYGYTTKTETDVKGGVPVVISGEDDLQD